MALKNSLLKACLKLFSSQHVAASKPKRILVVTTTALGDTIWATPALDSLKSSFPNAYIAVLTSPIGVQVLKGHPAINRFHLLQEPVLPRFFSLLHTLKAEQFDTILLSTHRSASSFLFARSLGPRVLWEQLASTKISIHSSPTPSPQHPNMKSPDGSRSSNTLEEKPLTNYSRSIFFLKNKPSPFLLKNITPKNVGSLSIQDPKTHLKDGLQKISYKLAVTSKSMQMCKFSLQEQKAKNRSCGKSPRKFPTPASTTPISPCALSPRSLHSLIF